MANTSSVSAPSNTLIAGLAGTTAWSTNVTYDIAATAAEYTYMENNCDYMSASCSGTCVQGNDQPLSAADQDIVQAISALESIADITFTLASSFNPADLKFYGYDDLETTSSDGLNGVASFPGTDAHDGGGSGFESFISYNTNSASMTTANDADAGSNRLHTVIHEIGHSLGLAHPHDGGNGTGSWAAEATDGTDNVLDNDRYTIMSYERHGLDQNDQEETFGYSVTPMALDVAALQHLYGSVENNGSDTTYTLIDAGAGARDLDGGDGAVSIGRAFFCIWDTGGTDKITYSGAEHALINLNEATHDQSGDTTEIQNILDDVTGSGLYGVLLPEATATELRDDISDPEYHAGGFFSRVFDATGVPELGGYSIANDAYADSAHQAGTGIENAEGSSSGDILIGNALENYLTGNAGADLMHGGSNNDVLYGGAGADEMWGGTGDDKFRYSDGVGAAAGEIVQGDIGTDTIWLLSSADYSYDLKPGSFRSIEELRFRTDPDRDVTAVFTSDMLDSPVEINPNLVVTGWAASNGSNRVLVEMNTATLDLSGWTFTDWGANGDLVEVTGAGLGENVIGSSAVDSLSGNDGNDTLSAGAAMATTGDTLDGGAGNDSLIGNNGANGLTGGAGDDILDAGQGADVIHGGDDSDTAIIDRSNETTAVSFALNSDGAGQALPGGGSIEAVETISMTSGTGNDDLAAAGGNDTLTTGDGDDTLSGGSGNDSLDGGNDSDTALFLGSIDTTVDLTTSSGQNTGHGIDTLIGIENVTSGTGNDSLTGNGSANILIADDGDDSLNGGAGDDSLDGGDGDDTLYFTGTTNASVDLRITGGQATGYGNDTVTDIENLWSDEGDDSLLGDDGVNVLHGGTSVNSGNDTLRGFGGDDSLYARYGADQLFGGNGNDLLYTYLDDSADLLDGEAGDDELQASNWRSYTAVDTLLGGTGNDTLYLAQDLVALGGAEHVLDGGADDDVLHVNYSGAETDVIVFTLDPAGAAQTIPGGGQVQACERLIMNTGRGDDSIAGAAGNDTIGGNRGADTLVGNGGDDRLTTTITDTVGDSLLGGDGSDTLMAGNAGDTLKGGGGNDSLYGYGGNDRLTGGADDDLLNGGSDTDTAFFTGAADITVDLRIAGGQNTGQGIDTLEAIEDLVADAGNDRLTGDGGDNRLTGNGGSDTLNGGGGADTLRGGTGNDLYVVDNAGDTVSEAGGGGTDMVKSSVGFVLGGGLEKLTLSGGANINGTGNGAKNTILGNDAGNTLQGLNGNDTIKGQGGNDKLYGGNDNDKLYGLNDDDKLYGDKGNDRLFGGRNDDRIYGGRGKDTLDGDAGRDKLWGDEGNDRIIGGSGTDMAVYAGNIDRYKIVKVGAKIKVIDQSGGLGKDTLSGVEKLKFGGKVYTVKKALKLSDDAAAPADDDDVSSGIWDSLDDTVDRVTETVDMFRFELTVLDTDDLLV